MLANRRSGPLGPPRVRNEPPTISEAFAAASDLTQDPDLVVEIAAGLMGISVEEARQHSGIFSRPNGSAGAARGGVARPSGRAVVVERRRRVGLSSVRA